MINERIINEVNAERCFRADNEFEFVSNLIMSTSDGYQPTNGEVFDIIDRLDELMYEKARSYTSQGHLTDSGAFIWNSNGCAVPEDIAQIMLYHKQITRDQLTATANLRERQTAEAIASYRANYTGPSDEELAEMRAAFGPGEVVVNVLTGHRTQL